MFCIICVVKSLANMTNSEDFGLFSDFPSASARLQEQKATTEWNSFDIYSNKVEAWKEYPDYHKPNISLHYIEVEDSING